jgi:hypothetical protein
MKQSKTLDPRLNIVNNPDVVLHLEKWIALLTSPFQKEKYSRQSYQISSILDPHRVTILGELDLVRVDFVTTLEGLYDVGEVNPHNNGYIILSINGRAHAYLPPLVARGKPIRGTYESVAKRYFDFLRNALSIHIINGL